MAPPVKLGQHFLRDTRIIRRILDAADLQPTDRVLEIGPGEGVLTGPMAQLCKEVVCVEFDPELARNLEGKYPNVSIHLEDAVKADLAALGPFDKIVSNLPYQISGPITMKFMEFPWSRAVLMYQKEFADRLTADPGTKKYGRITTHAARYATSRKVCHVSAQCFSPPPKVGSSVILLEPHEGLDVGSDALWRAIVDGSFQNRRKQLKNTIPTAVAAFGKRDEALRVLEEMQLLDARPETVGPSQFAALSRALS